MRAAAVAVEAVGFRRSYFGTWDGELKLQGTWPVTFDEICRETSVVSGATRITESGATRSGEVIVDVTAQSAGRDAVTVKASLLRPRATRSNCRVTGNVQGHPGDWEARFFQALERALASPPSSLPAPRATNESASQMARRYGFEVAVEGKKVMIVTVRPGSRGELAGVRAGDEIVKVFERKPNRNLELLWADMMSGHIQHGALLMQVQGSDGRKRSVRIADR